MGNFFTSTQIYSSDAAERDKFIDTFCKAMEKEGYVTCDCDESERDYILKFADNCNWVTITSESYEQGNQTALSDTGRIAKMLKTTCVNTTVIDSDCAVMALYAKSGQKADTLVIGRADDYFGRKVPKLSKDVWKPFLADGSSWEQLCGIVEDSENYTFIEDCLSELAPIIGMDDSNILFSAEDAEENDEQTVFLGFKKAEAKEKKLTLNAAFKQVFGKMLEPMGFKLIKSKYPYFLRVVGEGIIQSVSVAKEKHIDDPNEEGFTIYIGVNLISSEMPDFDKSPAIFDNMGWMTSLNDWYGNFSQYLDGFNKYYEGDSLFYKKGEAEKMLDSLEKVSQEYMPFVLEYIEKLITLEDIYQAGFIVEGGCHDATILLERVDKKIEQLKIALTEEIKRLESVHANNPVLLKIGKEHIIKSTEKLIKRWISFKKGGDAYDEFMKTAVKTKAENLEILKGYGIDADQFE